MRFSCLFIASTTLAVACVNGNGDNTLVDGGSDATTDVAVEAEASIPTGATLTIGVASTWVPQNGQATVPFTVARNGVAGALTVHAIGLPTGVTAADATVPDGQSTGTITLAASGSATLGDTGLANLQLFDQTQKEDQKQLVVRVSGKPGDPDTTWGQGGILQLPLTSSATGYGIDVYPANAGANAGKIVIVGGLFISSSDVRIVIARYNVSGALDTTFGDVSADGGTGRIGYTIFNPGPNDTSFTTYPTAVRVDSKGRIAVVNRRLVGGICGVELGRWTVDGDVDSTFTRYSANLNGAYCGGVNDLAVTPSDDLAVLAQWNIATGVESIVQLFSGTDGSRQASGFHISLDTSGTGSNQKTTGLYQLRIDKSAGFILAGWQCNGGWNSSLTGCNSVIARLTPNGQRDSTFGASAGYTGFKFGTDATSPERFLGVGIDPVKGDIIGAGLNEGQTLGTLARVSGSSGLPVSFGSQGSLTRDLLSGSTTESLSRVMVDSAGRLVAAGSANKSAQSYIVRMRSAADGTLDASYAAGGIGVTIGPGTEDAALGNDDRLYIISNVGSNMAVYRYWP